MLSADGKSPNAFDNEHETGCQRTGSNFHTVVSMSWASDFIIRGLSFFHVKKGRREIGPHISKVPYHSQTFYDLVIIKKTLHKCLFQAVSQISSRFQYKYIIYCFIITF